MISNDHALRLADVIISLLKAGHSIQRALFEAPKWLDASVADVVRNHTTAIGVGRPLTHVIAELGSLNPLLIPILEVVAQAADDGAPAVEQLEHIVADVRSRRRRLHEQHLARLPVQLIMPVVACILPAFILLGVVPLFVAVMPSLGTPTIP